MKEILASILNGQRKQAIEQVRKSLFDLDDVFERLISDGDTKEIIRLYRVAVSVGYITVNG